jgi:hypothetical protein
MTADILRSLELFEGFSEEGVDRLASLVDERSVRQRERWSC